jgi:hypothetical protein
MCHQTNMLITERRRRRPRRGFVPQAQAAQQRLKHAPVPYAPPSYGQVSNSSKAHRREGLLVSVCMKLVLITLFFCSSAGCSSPAATASHCNRQRPKRRPGHHDQVLATHSERRRGQRLEHNDQVPATHKERRLFFILPRTDHGSSQVFETPSAFLCIS